MAHLDTICRFCGIESTKLIAVLELSDTTTTTEPNLLQKIQYCLPVEINYHDAYPKRICQDCCTNTHNVYKFIETILTTQKVLSDKIDNIKLIQTNKTKLISKINAKLLPCEENKTDYTVALSINKESAHQPSNEISKILEKLKRNKETLTVSLSKVQLKEQHANESSRSKNDDKKPIEQTLHAAHMQEQHSEKEEKLVEPIEYVELEEEILYLDEDSNELNPNKNENFSDHPEEQCQKSSEYNMSDFKTELDEAETSANFKAGSKKSKVIIVQMKNPAQFVCTSCKAKFPTFTLLKLHLTNCQSCKNINLTCETCGKIWNSKKALYQHILTHKEKHASFVCEECGKIYSNRFNLENHKYSMHHLDLPLEDFGSIYKCKKCDEQFSNRQDLYNHINNHAKIQTVNLCETCGKCFNSSETLRAHLRIHLDIRPFPCTYCEKKFRSRLHLTQHLHVHTGIKSFSCSQCAKVFAKKGSLALHERIIHSGETPYKCSKCPKKFMSPSKLKTHTKHHEAE